MKRGMEEMRQKPGRGALKLAQQRRRRQCGSVILSIPGAFQADSPRALERCRFHQLPSSAALPLLPLVPGATRLCPASVCALGLPMVSSSSRPLYCCDHLFFLENHDLCVLALSFGGGGGRAAWVLPLPVVWMPVKAGDVDGAAQIKAKSESLRPGWPDAC